MILFTATARQDIFSKPSQSMVAQAKNVMTVVPYLKSCDSASVAQYFAQPVSASVGRLTVLLEFFY